jgi:hypothetical protein
MTPKGAGGRELAELVANHLLAHEDWHVLPAVMDGDGVANHARENGAGTGPRANNGSLIRLVEDIDLLLQFRVDVRPLLG